MGNSKIADECRAVLAEAERSDPEAHGWTQEDLRDLGELLRASAQWVQLKAQADEAHARVVLLARRATKDWTLSDEEAIRKGGALAIAMLAPAPAKPA